MSNQLKEDWEKNLPLYELDEIIKPRPRPPTLWELNSVFARRSGNAIELRLSPAQPWVSTKATLLLNQEKLAIH